MVGGLYRAYAAGAEVAAGHVLDELGATMPLSRTRAEEIERLRAWASGRAVSASGYPIGQPPSSPPRSDPPNAGYA